MGRLNHVSLEGNLTYDPELQTGQNGNFYLNFTVAQNELVKGEEIAYFYDIKAFGPTAEFIAKYFKKGKPIQIQAGKLRQDKWEDKTTGEKRSKVVIIAREVGFVGGPKVEEEVEPDPTPEPEPVKKPASTPKRSKTTKVDDEDVPF